VAITGQLMATILAQTWRETNNNGPDYRRLTGGVRKIRLRVKKFDFGFDNRSGTSSQQFFFFKNKNGGSSTSDKSSLYSKNIYPYFS